ncbi:MAG TPA: trypsin-like peptidase domain-containing protein [bacterium]|nr:trypsin-like peptidase domain-containing protein [bacterium]
MKKLLPYVMIVALSTALVVSLWVNWAGHPRHPIPGPVVPVSVSDDVSASRTNAIVLAARKISPAVVSVVVTQTRVVTYDPFGGLGLDDFFRDFAPRQTYRQEVKSMGSGVIISSDGDIVTNAHVVLNATQIKVTLPDNRTFPAELEGIDETRDLALLKLKAGGLPSATLGNSDDLMIGEWSIAIGNPFGFMIEDAQPTVTVGVISALHRDIKSEGGDQVYSDMVQTDAAINPGNSGGPLVNAAGEVIGINTFIFSHSGGSEGIGFARPINDVKQFVKETRNSGGATSYERVKTGLGATVADINPTLRGSLGLAYRRGVVVVEVDGGSVGETIGMATGDVILMAQGKTIGSAAAFARLYEHLAGTIDIVIDRGGEQIRLLYRLR